MKNKARQTQRNTRRISAIRNKTTQSNRTEACGNELSAAMRAICSFMIGYIIGLCLVYAYSLTI
jgi:hypothetical protein